MVSPINYNNPNINFTPQPFEVVNSDFNYNQTNQNDSFSKQEHKNPLAALNLRTPQNTPIIHSSMDVKGLLIYGITTGVVLAGLLKTPKIFSASKQVVHIPILDAIIPVTTVKELKKYLSSINRDSKEFVSCSKRKIKISFPVEDYSKDKNKNNFLSLSPLEINKLKNDNNRINDITQAINGTIEAHKRMGNKRGLKIVFNKDIGEKENSLLDHIYNNNGIIDVKNPEIREILSDVTSIESISRHKGIKLVGLNEQVKKYSDNKNFGTWFKKTFEL